MSDSTGLEPQWIIGLMSGTSVDTIDAVLCEVGPGSNGRWTAAVRAFHEQPVPGALRRRIFQAFADGPNSLSLACSLNFEIGAAFAEAARQLLALPAAAGVAPVAVASHGQTLYHIAPHMARGQEWVASTLQMGEPAVIAEALQLPIISGFRTGDMAVGGNGAPLLPFADWHLFSLPNEGVVVHNLGGIANCTWLPPSGRIDHVAAFDTGPANMIMDAFVEHFFPGTYYDKDGALASAGQVIHPLLDQWMAIPYITAPPPKSTGRELFGAQMAAAAWQEMPRASAEDLIATATEFTALSLAENLRLHVAPHGQIDHLLLAGGGAHNPFLVGRITALCQGIVNHVGQLDDVGISAKARECVGFAMMGYARLNNRPGNVPSATGASRPALLGSITLPSSLAVIA